MRGMSAAALFLLAGCATTQPVTETKLVPTPVPSDRYFVCPEYKLTKPASQYSYADIAQMIVELKANNDICRQSLRAIRQYLESYQAKFDKYK